MAPINSRTQESGVRSEPPLEEACGTQLTRVFEIYVLMNILALYEHLRQREQSRRLAWEVLQEILSLIKVKNNEHETVTINSQNYTSWLLLRTPI